MDTCLNKPLRRQDRPEFKQPVVDACLQPGASVAGVALAYGLNANLVRRWLQERGELPPSRRLTSAPVTLSRPQCDALVLGLPWHNLRDGGVIRLL